MSALKQFSLQELESFDDLDQILLIDLNKTYPFDNSSFSGQTAINEEENISEVNESSLLSHSNSSNDIQIIDESSVIEVDSADVSPPKIKRQKTWIPYRYRRRANLIPKIPPRDIRRELPSIHARVQNSFDPTFYFQYLNKFCIPDMVYQVTYMDHLSNGMFSKPFYGQTIGFEHLITGYIYFKERYPDFTFQVSNIKIHQQLFSRDIILFSDIFVSMTDPLYEQRSSDDIDILKNTFNGPKAENFEVLENFITKSPKKVSKGTMTIFVNELGQIYNMHLAVVNFQAPC